MPSKPSYADLQKRIAELEESERKYRQLFETAMVGMYRTRIEDGKFLDANESLARMMGYDSAETFLQAFVTVEHYADPGRRVELMNQLEKEGVVDGFEIEMIKRDGSHVYLSISAIIYPEHGYTEGVILDVTGQKDAQKGLIEAYDIITKSPAVAFLWRNAENWPVEYVSENVEMLLGIRRAISSRGRRCIPRSSTMKT